MSGRAWGWLILAVSILVVGVALCVIDGLNTVGPIAGVVLCLMGIVLAGWVAMGCRSTLSADEQGFTYRSWRGKQTITWERLSSLQFKIRGGGRYATELVVVNDMGRKEMQIPIGAFERKTLHDWVSRLPARSSGREYLLD